MGTAVLEYWLEMLLFPSLKKKASLLSAVGLGMCVLGEIIRKVGMVRYFVGN